MIDKAQVSNVTGVKKFSTARMNLRITKQLGVQSNLGWGWKLLVIVFRKYITCHVQIGAFTTQVFGDQFNGLGSPCVV